MKKFDEALEILLLFLGSVLVSVLVCLFLVLLMGQYSVNSYVID